MTPLELASRSFRVIETGDPDLANQLIDPAFVNQETADDPEDVDARSTDRPASWPPAAGCAQYILAVHRPVRGAGVKDVESWARSQPEQAHAMELSPPPCLC